MTATSSLSVQPTPSLPLLQVSTTPTTSTTTTTTTPSATHHDCCKKWLVVDFDETLTRRDTTSVLPLLAAKLSCQASRSKNEGDNEHEHDEQCIIQERIHMFQSHQEDYFRLYTAAKRALCHEHMSLEQALDSLDDVSTFVTRQVSASGVLRGLGGAPLSAVQELLHTDQVKSRVQLQDDCLDVLAHHACHQQWQLAILSINWCPSLIDAAVVRPLLEKMDKENMCATSSSSSSSSTTTTTTDDKSSNSSSSGPIIWSNSVDADGVVSLSVPGAIAKKECIQRLQTTTTTADTATTKRMTSSARNFVVYIGDSSTDLAALLQADIGILLVPPSSGTDDTKSSSAVQTARRWGVQVRPLSLPLSRNHYQQQQRQQQQQSNMETNKVIWLAKSWLEIDCVLKDVMASC